MLGAGAAPGRRCPVTAVVEVLAGAAVVATVVVLGATVVVLGATVVGAVVAGTVVDGSPGGAATALVVVTKPVTAARSAGVAVHADANATIPTTADPARHTQPLCPPARACATEPPVAPVVRAVQSRDLGRPRRRQRATRRKARRHSVTVVVLTVDGRFASRSATYTVA
ncbi:MAG: hypothetical protein M3P85_01120 [Actinomycetota bacterium]|nr:hypothetical protein [Actinomycetota bacterium]